MSRKNASKAMRLAVFIARYHTGPRSNRASFVLVREKLISNGDLGLTENEIRGSIKALIDVGFIEKIGTPGYERCPRTTSGVKRRCANYRIGADFQAGFVFLRKLAKRVNPEIDQSPKCRGITFPRDSHRSHVRKARATIAVHSGDLQKQDPRAGSRAETDADLASALSRFEVLFRSRGSGASPFAQQALERASFLEKPVLAEAGDHVSHAQQALI